MTIDYVSEVTEWLTEYIARMKYDWPEPIVENWEDHVTFDVMIAGRWHSWGIQHAFWNDVAKSEIEIVLNRFIKTYKMRDSSNELTK